MPTEAFAIAWIIWLISWFAAAAWTERTVRRPTVGREVVYRVLTMIGAVLMFNGGSTRTVLWQASAALSRLLFALTVIGFAFTWWARLHLGRLWSSSVTRKEHHHVVDTGPYSMVRHPIYTGLLLAIVATALARVTDVTIAGAAVLASGIYIKARLEEKFLREQLGAAYDEYARRVPMLIPFVTARPAR
jgi:protein-S-isoprenylcysteine O-methyltransferase Ste14